MWKKDANLLLITWTRNLRLNMSNVAEILHNYWGYPSLKPSQQKIVDSVLAGKDTCAFLPTGGGKSLCFQVPALAMDGICIVISPLIALMQDQVSNLQQRGIKALLLQGGMKYKEVLQTLDNCQYGNYKFLYLSPERLQQEVVQERIKQMNVSLIAVDEAHCISQWGHDFRPSYRLISTIRALQPKANCIALTATATEKVQQDIIEVLKLKEPSIIKLSFKRENIGIKVQFTNDKRFELIQILKNLKGSGIVYVRNRALTKELASFLCQSGIPSAAYNGGMPKDIRKKVLEEWLNNSSKVVVATNAFGMGIDKADVRKVVHFNLAENIENYFQEIGRCGRDGKESEAIILYNESDILKLTKQFVDVIPNLEEVKHIYRKLTTFFSISYGEGEGESFDFNFFEFCQRFQLNTQKVYSCLEILDRMSILVLSKNYQQQSQFQFIVGHKELLHFSKTHFGMEKTIQSLLRTYGGIFDHPTQIDISLLQRKTEKSKEKINYDLQFLDQQGIAKVNIKEQDLSIQFLVPKENERTINPLGKDIIAYKKGKEKQVQAVIDFLKNTTTCRSVQLMEYFNEKEAQKCGKCSICLGLENSSYTPTQHSKDCLAFIVEELNEGNYSAKELIEKSRFTREEIVTNLRRLLEAKKIKLNPNNTYSS